MLDNVIIIPYREREKHLKYYLENTLPLLRQYLPNSKIVIIEQVHGWHKISGDVVHDNFREALRKELYPLNNVVMPQLVMEAFDRAVGVSMVQGNSITPEIRSIFQQTANNAFKEAINKAFINTISDAFNDAVHATYQLQRMKTLPPPLGFNLATPSKIEIETPTPITPPLKNDNISSCKKENNITHLDRYHKWQLFNRGKILNVGFKEYNNKTKYFITNDVDLNPQAKMIKEYYLPDISGQTVRRIYTSGCETLGGIIKIKAKDIFTINGFPNTIWGWGHEDKALYNRAKTFNLTMKHFMSDTKGNYSDDYIIKFDDINDRKHSDKIHMIETAEYKIFPTLSPSDKKKAILNSGLNNISYTVVSREQINDYTEHIKVMI